MSTKSLICLNEFIHFDEKRDRAAWESVKFKFRTNREISWLKHFSELASGHGIVETLFQIWLLRTESNRKLPILKWPGSGRCSLAPSVCYRIVEFNEALGLLPWPNLEYDCIRQGLLTRARPGIIIILRPGISQFARVCFDLMKPLDCGREGKFWEVKLISMRIWVIRMYIGRTFQL